MDSSGPALGFLPSLGTWAIRIYHGGRENGRPRRRVHRRGNRAACPNWEQDRMTRQMQIGFTQRLQLQWLDRTAGLLSAGNACAEIKAALTDILKDQLSINGTAERGSRDKTITILLKTWVTVPRHLGPFRDEGLD